MTVAFTCRLASTPATRAQVQEGCVLMFNAHKKHKAAPLGEPGFSSQVVAFVLQVVLRCLKYGKVATIRTVFTPLHASLCDTLEEEESPYGGWPALRYDQVLPSSSAALPAAPRVSRHTSMSAFVTPASTSVSSVNSGYKRQRGGQPVASAGAGAGAAYEDSAGDASPSASTDLEHSSAA